MIHGKDIIMTVGDSSTTIAATKSTNLQISTDFIEVCSPTEGAWKEAIPTIHSWAASTEGLVASMSDYHKLQQYQFKKTKLMLCFYDKDLTVFYKGYGYIKSLDLKFVNRSLATMSASFQPSGALEAAEETVVDMSKSGRIVENRVISNNGTSISALVGRNLVLNEIVMSAYTRISLPTGAVLVKGDATTVAGYITNLETDRFKMATYVANFTGEYKDCRMQPGTVTVVASSLNTNELRYLSKF